MNRKNFLMNLIVLNLFLLLIILFLKVPVLLIMFKKLSKAILLPIIIGLFLYYLIRPLRNTFLKKGLSLKISVPLSLIISCLILYIFILIISNNIVSQWSSLVHRVLYLINNLDLDKFYNLKAWIEKYIDFNEIKTYLIGESKGYILRFGNIIKVIIDFGWNLFANIILFLLITYYLLKDDEKFKKYLNTLSFIKEHNKAEVIINKADEALFHYITGQACVAFSLSIIVFIGYWILNIPGKLILALSTFILAFIPFLGFFISMIIPYIITITLGFSMVIKLTIVFMIAQTIKGRFIVPLIMSRAMKIHPLTDIFLVIGAATLFGIAGAFLVVPIYAIVKIIWSNRKINLEKP